MSELYLKQQSLLYLIERALENFKKIGKNNYTPAKIRSRMASLKDTWNQCIHGHAALSQSIPAEKRESYEYFKAKHFDLADDLYQSTMDYMQECLEEIEPLSTSTPISNRSAIQNQGESVSQFSLSHLPPITIPPFSGQFEEWESFRDRFTSLIINNNDLSAFARMHFLTSSLTGQALESIKTIPITADNFEIAWKALTSRFENKRRLVEVHIASLQTLPFVSRESATELNNLRDKANRAIASLRNLKRTTEEVLSDMLVYIVSQRVDVGTRKAWKLKTGEDARVPTYDELDRFLAARARALEELNVTSPNKPGRALKPFNVTTATVSAITCPLCHAAHFINKCPQFTRKNSTQRLELIKQQKRCINCFSSKHLTHLCSSKYNCRICNKRHHSMLHNDSASSLNVAVTEDNHAQQGDTMTSPATTVLSSVRKMSCRSSVLLATARVTVSDLAGRKLQIRALLDQGSEITFISDRLGQLLNLRRVRSPISLSAVGGIDAGTSRYATQLKLWPIEQTSPALTVSASILKELTHYSPAKVKSVTEWHHLSGLPLADPDPTSSDPIDLLIGADNYSDIILDGLHKGQSGEPIAQNTIFGWVISGITSSRSHASSQITAHCLNSSAIEQELRRFWEIEEIPRRTLLSPEEKRCDEHFITTHTRALDGRYIVRLPFKTGPPIEIGESRQQAERQLQSLHRRFKLYPALQEEYAQFLREYEELGHMRPVSPGSSQQCVYIPHHPVVRDTSITTRLRVVFNASHKTTNATSLNDHMMASPKLQTDLSAVILRWRLHRYVFCADMEKMYRQIMVDSRDVDFQGIVWSADESQPVQEFQLLTLTYGTASAPFLALRVIQQLILDDGKEFPLAVSVLRDNLYVDDVLFGADDIHLARATREQLCSLLHRAHFDLRKWASNSAVLLNDIDVENHGLACNRTLQTDEHLKILGLSWNPAQDLFQFQVSLPERLPTTKRQILSVIAKFFDPLGWVTPVTITAKIFLQQLWRLKIGWDEQILAPLLTRWKDIQAAVSVVGEIKLNRWTHHGFDTVHSEIHGFADASNSAYAAVVYLRNISSSGDVSVSLLVGKSKVAPVKFLSIPRLELSATVLLARLIEFVRTSVNIAPLPCYCWTDSTIVLAWINQPASKWKTFVANRVAEIHSRIPVACWRHVRTQDNPADCASRGLLGHELVTHRLWWKGPPWLLQESSEWPVSSPPLDTTIDENTKVSLHMVKSNDSWELATKYSSWPKLLRITAYVLRFTNNLKKPSGDEKDFRPHSLALSPLEIQGAKEFWIRQIQYEVFSRELSCLSNNKALPSKGSLLSLSPFLDSNGIIRVGGRLKNASIPFAAKYPILLANHPIIPLIIKHAHLRSLHAGLQLTLSTLRQEYWILRGRTLVKSMIHKCVTCVRAQAKPSKQVMGDLPHMRVTPPSRAFLHCGVDYAGPIFVRSLAGRGVVSHKAYISLWVCLATRAIHLELVDGYTTAAFLAAYSRFCSRRGLPTSIYSDNGTFVGANRELARSFRDALLNPDFQNRTASDRVQWKFIPPSAPHFGGMWEAGVKSTKHHLRRVIGSHTLTFEEFATLLCQVEACLNSRPLAPLTDTLDDYDALTPGHFLIGGPLTAIPEPSLLHLKENRLTKWQLVRQIYESFWKRWKADYINTLQQRVKWRINSVTTFRVGQLVLLHNALLPPCKWELGRITQCHAGTDGLTRVVTIKTASSEYKRPISKICLLPIDCEQR